MNDKWRVFAKWFEEHEYDDFDSTDDLARISFIAGMEYMESKMQDLMDANLDKSWRPMSEAPKTRQILLHWREESGLEFTDYAEFNGEVWLSNRINSLSGFPFICVEPLAWSEIPRESDTDLEKDLSGRLSRVRSYLSERGFLTRDLKNLLNGFDAKGNSVSS